ncbi:inorganic pyrophosphatase [candidate division WS6 bacterium RIFOXYC1_FULL_33_9]|nr:MAG: inorganic pyrophosphatase [candidate division WS6 bacterium RIFOXYB1_FULL_33_15]OGC38201.1 MAG: inorganic pyrophosphatase [candidate division WS6 bacterium RIFOXYC1_FULL_33_9]
MTPQEYIGKVVSVAVDRKMGSKHPKHGFIYPINYGYIEGTKSADGEELDVYILGVFEPLNTFTGKVIAVIQREDDNDPKLVVVPEGIDYSNEAIMALTEFQERFFKSNIKRGSI